jgi:predicted amidohydrolase
MLGVAGWEQEVARHDEHLTHVPSTITVAAVQTAAHDRSSLPRAWPRIAGRAADAARNGADLVVLPEGTLPAYVLGYQAFEESEISAALADCRSIAREHHAVVVVGAARRVGTHVFNSAVVIDADGTIAGVADKNFLWHFDRQWFTSGERLQPIKTSLGALGVLICADGRIPTIARTLVDQGSQILVMPTAWVTSGRDPQHLENVQADLLARVRARENDIPFIAANKCGVELQCVAYCGKSQIVRADGTICAIASQDAEEIIAGTIQIGTPHPQRTALHVPNTQAEPSATPLRLAITPRTPHTGDAELLRILQADLLLYGNGECSAGDCSHIYRIATDEVVLDPGALANVRRTGGHDVALWCTSYEPQWQVPFARARAVELRMYLIVIDRERNRAFAVDPDGTVVCGTYDGYEIAAFSYDPARTAQTLVAPGTDVREGLDRAAQHVL